MDALLITVPREADIFLIEPGYERRTQSLRLEAEIDPPVEEVTWIVTSGDEIQKMRVSWPYAATWQLAPGRHHVQVVAPNRQSELVYFEVK